MHKIFIWGDERVINEVGHRCHMVRIVNVLHKRPHLRPFCTNAPLFKKSIGNLKARTLGPKQVVLNGLFNQSFQLNALSVLVIPADEYDQVHVIVQRSIIADLHAVIRHGCRAEDTDIESAFGVLSWLPNTFQAPGPIRIQTLIHYQMTTDFLGKISWLLEPFGFAAGVSFLGIFLLPKFPVHGYLL